MSALTPIPLHPMTDRVTEQYLKICADQPGVGAGCHHYQVREICPDGERTILDVKFQHGGIAEVGVNGVLTGTLLQILIHHLSGFQKGEFASRETALVITKLEEALQWSKQRELERAARGVLGQVKK
jgi:hypothetical protein